MQFILGNFGSGKTHYIIQEILNILQKKENFWIIVPSRRHKDQLFLDILTSQKGMIGNPILTLSEFQSLLIEHIFPNPAERPKTISNFEKFLIISTIIQQKSSHFKSFLNIQDRPEMIKMVYRLIQSLRDKDITQLASSPELVNKVHDLQLILEEYKNILRTKNMSDSAFEIDLICSHFSLLDPNIIPQHIFIDGFVDYTAIQFKLLSQFSLHALTQHKNVTISLTDLPHSICKETINHFQETFPNAEQIILDRSLPSAKLANSFLNNTSLHAIDLKIHEIQAFGNHKEVEYVTNQIKKLCLFENHRLEDIIIITDQQDRYAPLISSSLRKAMIPFIFGKDDKLSQNPLILFIKRCISLMLAELDHENLELLAQSNYIEDSMRTILGQSSEFIHLAIKGRKEAWKKGLARQNELNMIKEEKEELPQALESTILELCDHLFCLDPYKNYSISKHINSLISLLDFLGVQQTLSTTYTLVKHKKIIDHSIAKDYSALLKLKTILQELRRSLEEIGYKELNLHSFLFFFNIIIDETRYRSEIPQKNVLRILSSRDARGIFAKSVFILGMNEGEFPTPPKFELFDNADRTQLNNISKKILGQVLWDTDSEYFNNQKLSFATALTRTTEQIYFSRTPTNERGNYLAMSHFLKRILNKGIPFTRLPLSTKQTPIHWDNPHIFRRNLTAIEYYDYIQIPLSKKYQLNPHNLAQKDYINLIEQANVEFEKGITPSESALAYFGYLSNVPQITDKYSASSVFTSPTGLERLGRCRYQGLWQGIWKLKAHKLPEYKPEAADYGNLYHHVLELYIEKTTDRTDEHFFDPILLAQILKEYINDSPQSHVFSLDYQYLYTILSQFLQGVEPQLREQQKALFFELESGKGELANQEIPLNQTQSLKAFSRIDRVNKNTVDNTYAVIDYKKSGTNAYTHYQITPFNLFQGFLYSELLKNNNKAPVSSISYVFLEKQEIFKEYPAVRLKKSIFNSISEFQAFKKTEIIRLLELLSQGNFSPFTLESDIGEELITLFSEKFGEKFPREYINKCSYCDLKRLCLRKQKKLRSY